jgi:hypothetical protein
MRNWLANLDAQPQFTFHLTPGPVADLPAIATVIVDPAERRRLLAIFVEEFQPPPRRWRSVAGGGSRGVGRTKSAGQGHFRGDRRSDRTTLNRTSYL